MNDDLMRPNGPKRHRTVIEIREGGVKGLELLVERWRLCGDLSPASALAILQKDPPDMVLTHDQTHADPTIYSPFAATNFLERHYVKAPENSAGLLWVRRK